MYAKLAELTDLVEAHMAEAAEGQRQQYKEHSHERSFKVDDPVWLSIPTAGKLDPRWEGNWVVNSVQVTKECCNFRWTTEKGSTC